MFYGFKTRRLTTMLAGLDEQRSRFRWVWVVLGFGEVSDLCAVRFFACKPLCFAFEFSVATVNGERGVE